MKRIFFDIETTGVNIQRDRIIQIGMMVFEGNNLNEHTYLINPEVSIPEEATQIHGITNEDVKDKPTFNELASEIYNHFKDVDEIITHNGNEFDIPMLLSEFERVNMKLDLSSVKLIDTLQIERKLFPNTLDGLYYKYTKRKMNNHHDALEDTRATLEVFKGQLNVLRKEHPEALKDIENFMYDGKPRADIANKFKWNDDGILVWNFGKHKDLPISTDQGYLMWFMGADFPEQSKQFVENYINQ